MSSHPTNNRPSPLLVICSIIVVIVGLFLLANAIAACTVTWDATMMIAGSIFFPFPLFLCIQQYRGTFRCNSRAAMFAAIMLVVATGFAVLFFVGTLVDLSVNSFEIPWVVMLLILGLSVLTAMAARANLHWARTLSASETSLPSWAVRDLLAGLAALILVGLFTAYLVNAMPPQYAEHSEYERPPFGIPSGATDISFCQGAQGTIAYEFAIGEDGFRRWVEGGIGTLESQAANIRLLPIEERYRIKRYYSLTSQLDGPDSISITDGLYYDWSFEDRGVYAAYDAATNRAYYFFHAH